MIQNHGIASGNGPNSYVLAQHGYKLCALAKKTTGEYLKVVMKEAVLGAVLIGSCTPIALKMTYYILSQPDTYLDKNLIDGLKEEREREELPHHINLLLAAGGTVFLGGVIGFAGGFLVGNCRYAAKKLCKERREVEIQ